MAGPGLRSGARRELVQRQAEGSEDANRGLTAPAFRLGLFTGVCRLSLFRRIRRNALGCNGSLAWGRSCLERVTGIEPAQSAWKA
jgi:hypothetical protein